MAKINRATQMPFPEAMARMKQFLEPRLKTRKSLYAFIQEYEHLLTSEERRTVHNQYSSTSDAKLYEVAQKLVSRVSEEREREAKNEQRRVQEAQALEQEIRNSQFMKELAGL